MEKALIDERKVTLARNKSWASFAGVLFFLVIIWGVSYFFVNKHSPGNTFCFYLGVVIAFVFSITKVPYFVWKNLALSKRVYTRGEAPRLWDTVQKSADSFSLPMPKIYLAGDDEMNAWSFYLGLFRFAFVGVTKKLIENLNNKELTFVMMHEMSHIASKDGLLSWFLGLAYFAVFASSACLAFFASGDNYTSYVSVFMVLCSFYSLRPLCRAHLFGELHADAVAAQKIGSIKPAIDALTKAGLKSSDTRFKALKQLELQP